MARPARPVIGERTSVYSRSRRAVSNAASAAFMAARADTIADARRSYSSREMARLATSRSAREASLLAN